MGKNGNVPHKSAHHKKADRPEYYLDHAQSMRRQYIVYDKRTLQRTSRTCILFGHSIQEDEGDGFFYEIENVRLYYKGTLRTCRGKGCYYEELIGDKKPWKKVKVINGIEYDVTNRGRTNTAGVPLPPDDSSEGQDDSGSAMASELSGVVDPQGHGVDQSDKGFVPGNIDRSKNNKLGEPNVSDRDKEPEN